MAQVLKHSYKNIKMVKNLPVLYIHVVLIIILWTSWIACICGSFYFYTISFLFILVSLIAGACLFQSVHVSDIMSEVDVIFLLCDNLCPFELWMFSAVYLLFVGLWTVD